ncbi:MAG: hypothetical protein QOH50_3214 [Kribbellaceae bacterium]|nr:hypothetical protein [Kribbellaceae bacterium]
MVRVKASRLLPGALIWAGACLLLARYGTPWATVVLYSAYLSVGIMLPGTLLWRWLRGNVDGFAPDLAFGTGLGFAASILTYIPGRAIGLPILPLVVPVVTIVAFVVVPRLRANWQSKRAPLPVWWGWTVAGAAALGMWVITRYGLALEPLNFPDAAFQYGDMSYHLALAGELKHHMPGQIPYVAGEVLNYHWFLHAELAATSWQTGIEMDVLLRRMFPVTAALVPILSVAALATRLARRSWAGPVAAWLLLLVSSFDVYGWGGGAATNQAAFTSAVLMYSLTHAFSVIIALPAIWLLLCLVRGEGARMWGNWVLLAVGLAAVAGTKASFLPMLVAALALVIVVQLVVQRRVDGVVLGVAAVGVLVLGVAQVVLYSAGPAGLTLSPGQAIEALELKVGFSSHYSSRGASLIMVGTASAMVLGGWAVAGVGMLGFLRDRRWKDPAAVFLVGFLVAGLAAGVLLRHSGFSQLYFVRAAFPVSIVASAWGLTLLLDNVRLRVLLPRMVVALGAGMLLAKILSELTPNKPIPQQGVISIAIQVLWPWLAVLLVGAALALLLRQAPGRWQVNSLAVGLGVLLVLGASSRTVPTTVVTTLGEKVCASGPDMPDCSPTRRQIPAGGAAAARYIRNHSKATDRLATNSHCTPVYAAKTCDTRNFWLSAYAERRVLVEGWAYIHTAHSRANGSFWDQPLLRANDAIFRTPNRAELESFRTKYGVRWLVFDTNVSRPSAELRRLLPGRYASGSVEVFELTPLANDASPLG